MKKITELLEKLNLPFAIDKQLHFIAGFLIAMLFTLITGNVLAGMFFALFFAYAKEFYKSEKSGKFNKHNIFAILFGCVFFGLLYTSLMYVIWLFK